MNHSTSEPLVGCFLRSNLNARLRIYLVDDHPFDPLIKTLGTDTFQAPLAEPPPPQTAPDLREREETVLRLLAFVVGSSVLTEEGKAAEARTLGVNTILAKPYNAQTLLNTVAQVIQEGK